MRVLFGGSGLLSTLLGWCWLLVCFSCGLLMLCSRVLGLMVVIGYLYVM